MTEADHDRPERRVAAGSSGQRGISAPEEHKSTRRAQLSSTGSEGPMKSPNEATGSQARARAYAVAMSESASSGRKCAARKAGSSGDARAAPAGGASFTGVAAGQPKVRAYALR